MIKVLTCYKECVRVLSVLSVSKIIIEIADSQSPQHIEPEQVHHEETKQQATLISKKITKYLPYTTTHL